MKQALSLKTSQSMTMTPQLQQAIRLLQLSSAELELEIQAQLDANPMLEVDENDSSGDADLEQDSSSSTEESIDLDASQDMPDDLPVDSQWEDTFDIPTPTHSTLSQSSFDGSSIFDRATSGDTLQDHLLGQFELNPWSALDQIIGYSIIEGINDEGYLTTSFSDIKESVLNQLQHGQHIAALSDEGESEGLLMPPEDDEIQAMLRSIQLLDPIGCGSRDLKECLTIQLNQCSDNTPSKPHAQSILDRHFELLGRRDFANLMRRMKIDEHTLAGAIALIQSLDPRPGYQIGSEHSDYVVPDVIVKNVGDEWIVSLNPLTLPKLRLNPSYTSLSKHQTNKNDRDFFKSHTQEAKWFIKSLQSRHDTLLKVATEIVLQQKAFFEQGPQAMKPMVLADIADAVEMHESTISRVTSQKYMLTPRGIVELKFFFSSHVNTGAGGEASSTAIRAIIKNLIDAENTRKPLSDNKIAQILESEHDIPVARRTVAKYRELMNIPSSSDRKRLKGTT